MKRNKVIVVFMLLLSFVFQPIAVQAAFIYNGRLYLKPGMYERVEKIKRDTIGSPDEWIKCGNYYYEFVDDSIYHYITIRKVEEGAIQNGMLAIPERVDGYEVIGVGLLERPDVSFDLSDACISDNTDIIEKVVLPEKLEIIGIGSFYGCSNLNKVSMPNSLIEIKNASFQGCTKLQRIEFPVGVYVNEGAFNRSNNFRKVVLYSDCLIPFDCTFQFPAAKQTELYIMRHEKDFFELDYIPGYLQKVYVDKKLSEFRLGISRGEDDELFDNCVSKLIMNGKNTEFSVAATPDEIREMCPLRKLYTVKGAKSIKEAKKCRVPIYWKTVGKAQKVKGKKLTIAKKKKLYHASWKKIKTSVNIYHLDANSVKDKWIIKQRPTETLYRIYGKMKKSGSYHFIKRTKKKNITSVYPYIKASAVKDWV